MDTEQRISGANPKRPLARKSSALGSCLVEHNPIVVTRRSTRSRLIDDLTELTESNGMSSEFFAITNLQVDHLLLIAAFGEA
jgi:hypothetical protein